MALSTDFMIYDKSGNDFEIRFNSPLVVTTVAAISSSSLQPEVPTGVVWEVRGTKGTMIYYQHCCSK